jgi:hypothetical protein
MRFERRSLSDSACAVGHRVRIDQTTTRHRANVRYR